MANVKRVACKFIEPPIGNLRAAAAGKPVHWRAMKLLPFERDS